MAAVVVAVCVGATVGTAGAASAPPGGQAQALNVTDGRIQVTAGGFSVILETAGAWRGDVALDTTVRTSTVTGPGLATTARGAFAETVREDADGAEQSWGFDQAPGTSGDLTVAVAVPGLDLVGATDTGLRLRSAGQVDVSYSNGTWVDAAGHATAVPARYDNGRILLTVPADVVAKSSYPAVLDPKIIVTPIINS
jgi:hypothetical protein